jgi:hypothetical protein
MFFHDQISSSLNKEVLTCFLLLRIVTLVAAFMRPQILRCSSNVWWWRRGRPRPPRAARRQCHRVRCPTLAIDDCVITARCCMAFFSAFLRYVKGTGRSRSTESA